MREHQRDLKLFGNLVVAKNVRIFWKGGDKVKKLLMVGSIIGCVLLSGCNKTMIDTQYKFTKAKIVLGNETLTLDVKQWKDYEDSQIQIVTPDGKVYLTHSTNVLLMK
jgi:hypothetical protein